MIYLAWYIGVAVAGVMVWAFAASPYGSEKAVIKLWPLFTVAWPAGVVCLVVYCIVATVRAIGSLLE